MEFVSPQPLPHESVMDYSLLGGEHVERGRRLFHTGLALLVAALAYLAFTAKVGDPLQLLLGLAIFALSVLPALLWARSGGSRFPVFEPIMALCANSYALPLLNAQEQLAAYSPEVISRAAAAVVAFQVTGIVIYLKTTGLPGRASFWRDSIVSPKIEKLVIYGMLLSTIYVGISTFTPWITPEFESILRAVFFGIGVLCTFVSAQRWGRGELTGTEKFFVLATFVPQLVFMCVSLILIGALGLIGIALLGYLSGGKRVPWVAIAVTFACVAVLHSGKSRMREKYWEQLQASPTLTQLPAFFSEWIGYGLQPGDADKSATRRLLERTSLMHILCLVVSYSPDPQPYLYGKTYGYVLPQLIPRLFWPDKPRSHIATYELSIYYGLQREEDTENTTIAFGLLTEAYANFGLLGGILLGAFWGFTLKKLQVWSTFSPMFSFAGLLMILLTAWSFSSELTMAVWVSSLEQAVVVVIGIPMVIRSLFGS